MERMHESPEGENFEGKEKPIDILHAEWKNIEGIEELPPNVAEAVSEIIRNSDQPEHKVIKITKYREAEQEDGSKEYEVSYYYDADDVIKHDLQFPKRDGGRYPVVFRVITDKDGAVMKSEVYGM